MIAVLLQKRFLILVLLVLLAGRICVGIAAAQDTKKLVVPRTEPPPKIDGALDDPCWKTAARGDGLILCSVGALATEPTEFFVCYDKSGLYFGFYCHDSQPDKIKATQTERDASLSSDDYVRVYLDTYHLHRTADEFNVNAIGTQRDQRRRGTNDKISWKGDWQAAAKRVADGWTAEMQIPFSILNYPAGATSMGFNVRRFEQRLGEKSYWTYLDDDDQLARFGDLEGLVLPPPPRRPLQMMPYLLRTLTLGGGHSGRIGLDMKQPFGDDNTAIFTAYPDFGTIENAVKSIDFSYTAHRYSDNRPFFQEATSFFSSPYLYTTDIPDFDYGAKVYGRRGEMAYGLMGCTGTGQRRDYVLSLGYDLPRLTTAQLMIIGRKDDAVDNKVASFLLGGQPIPSTSWWARGARSFTAGAAQNGSDLGAGFRYASKYRFFEASFGHVSTHFNPADGYVDYPGASNYNIGGGYEVDQPGKWIRYKGFGFAHSRTWDPSHGIIDRSTDLGFGASFANHTSWQLSHTWGPHIANYDADPGTPYYWNSDSGYAASYSFRTNDLYRSGGLSYRWGQVGGGASQSIQCSCGFLPMKRFSTNISVEGAHRSNPAEGTITRWLGILGARYELTPEKSLAARLLHQEGGVNLTLSYRQQVRQGLDIFALFGDYNADHTVNRLSIKLIATL
jgi:hypothetical protein